MTERFRLAANVLLKRRLNNLVRIDNNIEIDRDYITCAEYQLFIDYMWQAENNSKPDHWISEKFPLRDAKNPITGVRRSDAEKFCEWLTNKETLAGFKYRLPKLAETREIVPPIRDVGCWCQDNDTFAISGITSKKWKIWQQKLSACLGFKDDFILNLDLDLDLDLNRYLNLELDLNLNLNLDLDLDLDLDLNRYLDLDLNLDLNRYLELNRYLDLYQDLDRYLQRYLNRDLDLDLDLNREFYSYVYRYLYQEIDSNQASNLLLIYFPLIIPILFYQSLSKIYGEVAQNRKMRQKINLNRQYCEQESIKYARKKDDIFQLYAYLVLIDQRQKGNMPAWEGIRIVREREEID